MSKAVPNKQTSQRIVRELFHLSDEVKCMQEDVLDDFSCALRKKISIHGRLFCTDNFICFYANILGFKTKLVIAFKEVTAVVKSPKEARAIEVVCGPKTHLFRSFYRSNDALQFIHTLWRNTGAADAEDCGRWSDDEDAPEEEGKDESFVIPPDQNVNAFETLKTIVPVSPQQFFDLFCADAAPFSFRRYYESRGDTEIEFMQWTPNEEMGGFTRDVKFRTKIKGVPIGPKTTRCEIAQQYQLQPSKLLVKQSCKALDVPFASYFLLEQEWVVHSIAPDKSILRISAAVNFLKSTIFKSTIEGRTKTDVTKDHEGWLLDAKANKAFPDVPVQQVPESKTEEKPAKHSVARYEEVDPKNLNRKKELKTGKSTLLTIALLNSFGLLALFWYLLFLHSRLDSKLHLECA